MGRIPSSMVSGAKNAIKNVVTLPKDGGSSGFYKVTHETGYNVSTNGERVVVHEAADGGSAPVITFEPNVETNGAYGVQRILHKSTLKEPIWTQVHSTTNGVPTRADSVTINGIEKTADGTKLTVNYGTPAADTQNS